eukprot:gene33195-40962_t
MILDVATEDDMDAVYAENVIRMGEKYQGNELGGSGAFGNGDRAGHDEEGEIDMKMFKRQGDASTEAMLKKQAFLSCDVEWSQYPKAVELTAERGLNRAVPRHFQYLTAEWMANSESGGRRWVVVCDTPLYGGLVHAVESSEDLKF